MKITQERLKQIIKEEMASLGERHSDGGLAIAKEEASPDMFGEPDEEGGMARSELFKIGNYGQEIRKMLENEDQLPAWVQSKITRCAAMLGDVKHFLEGEMADKSEQMSPEQSEMTDTEESSLDEMVMEELDALHKKKKKVNPWAVCTSQVGREDKAKYERCVLKVKKKSGIK